MREMGVVYGSKIEEMLGFNFVSDPRGSTRFPLPEPPKGHNMEFPYQVGADKIEITPAMAAEWLMYRLIRREVTPADLIHPEFCDNRKIVLKAAREWKATVEAGKINPRIANGVVFTPDGFLLDGQHRLIGCVLGNRPIRLPITVNAAWDTFGVTDSGTARTASQMLGSEYPEAQLSPAAARMILTVLAGDDTRSHAVSHAHREDLLDLIRSWPFFRDKKTFALMRRAHKGSGIQLSHLIGVCAMAHAALTQLGDAYPGDGTFEIDYFLEGLCSHSKPFKYEDFGTGSDPRYMLREQFRGNVATKNAEEQRKAVSTVRRGMTIWLNRHVKRVQISSIGLPKSTLLHPTWRADLVQEYAAARQIDIIHQRKG